MVKLKILSKNNFSSSEKLDAEVFWKEKELNKDVNNQFYFNEERHWSKKIAEIAKNLKVKSAFEFGCAGGSNLFVIKNEIKDVEILGYDVNKKYLDWGIERYGLNLERGNATKLLALTSNSFDLVFTVSVIDHIIRPKLIIDKLIDISKGYFLFIEPVFFEEEEGRVLSYLFDSGEIDALPFTYNWHIDKYINENKKVQWLRVDDFPLYEKYSGPYYKMFLGKVL